MRGIDWYNIIAHTTPACSALLMMMMLGWDMINANRCDRQPKKWLFYFFMSLVLNVLFPIFNYYMPGIFVYFNWLSYLILFLTPVLFYHFLFEIVRTSSCEHFQWQHYIFPIAASSLVLILSITLPYEEQYRIIVEHYPINNNLYRLVAIFSIPLKFLFELIYLVICYIRLRNYHKFMLHDASYGRKLSLRWMYRCLLMIVIMTSMTLVTVCVSPDTYFSSPVMTSPLFILAFLQLNIAFHTLREDYIILETAPMIPLTVELPLETTDQLPVQSQKKDRLTKTLFEEYIHTYRPYLNSNLKITDLVYDLELNRTYISGFINREYNMNFSRYINCLRLDEYHRLLADPAMKGKSKEELSELAGFSSYRYFLRLKNGNHSFRSRSD